jgi:hypothetical protein
MPGGLQSASLKAAAPAYSGGGFLPKKYRPADQKTVEKAGMRWYNNLNCYQEAA